MISKRFRQTAATILFSTALLTLPACLSSYGRIKANPDLTNVFKQQQTLPDYIYYYCGRENLPYAVVGIDPRYEFQDRLWHRLETKAAVSKSVAGIRLWNDRWARGAEILDPAGNRIGIWFSYYSSTTVKVGPGNRVAVYNPYHPFPWATLGDNDAPP